MILVECPSEGLGQSIKILSLFATLSCGNKAFLKDHYLGSGRFFIELLLPLPIVINTHQRQELLFTELLWVILNYVYYLFDSRYRRIAGLMSGKCSSSAAVNFRDIVERSESHDDDTSAKRHVLLTRCSMYMS